MLNPGPWTSSPRNRRDKSRSLRALGTGVVLLLLLLLPLLALHHHGVTLAWSATYLFLMSAFTFWGFRHDKRAAQHGRWRQTEASLHLLELLGGWPGAFLAQRFLRHKASKLSYQLVFWIIVLAYQCAALESLRNAPWLRAILP